ncbi:photosystem I assembly protein Ycf3 [Rubripirellula reticaptiva]|uniref:Photosystem I assembly protein Ycf3 n=2 Tax=Rubripirellula reticaptiva TaxID=2528013 RepID=A0A5C6F9A4_9BACT|nr:photosystem I assembly protein Ycf3 [Rubripirellula reticaptiva]
MASMNPFAKSSPSTFESSTMGESVASSDSGAGSQVKAVAVSTKNAIGKTATAMTSVFRRKSEEVVDSPDQADPLRLDNKPDKVNAEVFVANGQLWESTGDFGKAMESYTKALESTPNHPQALNNIARLHFTQGNLPQAAKTFQVAINQTPNDAGLYNDLGLTLSKMGNHAGAIETLEKSLQLAPGTSRYANNLATVKFESGDPASAMQVLAQNNKPAVAHFNMAYLHFKSGQLPQARAQISEALKFESQAGGDVAVGRAIERSREMLAQIDASSGTVAQAAPQASQQVAQYAAAAPQPNIQQTGRPSNTANLGVANVSASSSIGPATAAITAAPKPTGQVESVDLGAEASTPSKASWSQAWNPNWQQESSAPATTPETKAIRPTEATPAETKPTEVKPAAIRPTMATPSASTTAPASSGFTMPE